MVQGEHSAILLTFIKLPFVIKIFVLSIFEWPLYTGFTVYKADVNTRHYLDKKNTGMQRLSGSVLASRPKGCVLEPHR